MSLFIPLGWIDTWALSCSLRAKQKDLVDAGPGFRAMDVLGADKARWQTALNVVARVRRRLREAQQALPALMSYEIAEASLQQLDARAVLPWDGGAPQEIVLHVGIVTNPFCRLYAGVEIWSLGVGDVVALAAQPAIQRCEANHGDTARVHLCVTLRQKPLDDEQ